MGQARRNKMNGKKNSLNFDDVNKGYEVLVTALKKLGVRWEDIARDGIKCYVAVANTTDKEKILDIFGSQAQLAFEITPDQKQENGLDATEFSIFAGIWTGISETIKEVANHFGTEKKFIVPLMAYSNGKFTFAITPEL